MTGRTFVILPVHNRREITLGCLRHLRDQGDLDWLEVIVVDDGSADGTGEAVRAEFPKVLLMHGNGGLWWTGAIRAGMEEAHRRGASCILWLNDDTLPHPNVLRGYSVALRDGCIASARGAWRSRPAPEDFKALEKTRLGKTR